MNLRPALAAHLGQRLEAFGEGFRHNLAIIGPPGSGKTFQLQELMSHQPPNVRSATRPTAGTNTAAILSARR